MIGEKDEEENDEVLYHLVVAVAVAFALVVLGCSNFSCSHSGWCDRY
jgi:hypothetical protein